MSANDLTFISHGKEIQLPHSYDARISRLLKNAKEQALQDKAAAEGRLEEITETDRTGRKISRFRGDPELVWGSFKQLPRVIKSYSLTPKAMP